MRKKRKLSKKEQKALKNNPSVVAEKPYVINEPVLPKEKKKVEIEEQITVSRLASSFNIPPSGVIKALMQNGILATINETIDWETASIVGSDLGFDIEVKKETKKESKIKEPFFEKHKGKLSPRPPVVAVMGHIDHGKTTLLSALRKIDMLKHEAGGITQHIGAYQIDFKGQKITFVDTPGHEAFETMRKHGAKIVDIVILVVAAEEGIKPQTVEAIQHAKKANVPIIVAINKIDLPNANIAKVKGQLQGEGLVPEDMGGDTVAVEISAKQEKNLDELLEMILLLAEIKGFRADFKKPGRGVIIESKRDAKIGPVASVLIQEGTLKKGDFFVTEKSWGKVRFIEDDYKKRLSEAGPSRPVRISGFKQLPVFGEILHVVSDERTAQSLLAEMKKKKASDIKIVKKAAKSIPLIIKADAFGSLKAILDNLRKLETQEVSFNLIKEGAGNISEDDVIMASTSQAVIVGFKVDIFSTAFKLAEEKKVKVLRFEIIYELIKALEKLIESAVIKQRPQKLATFKVIKVFKDTNKEKIIGGKALEGEIKKGLTFAIWHEHKKIGEGRVKSLQMEKEKVDKLEAGSVGGLAVVTEAKIEGGSVLEFWKKTN